MAEYEQAYRERTIQIWAVAGLGLIVGVIVALQFPSFYQEWLFRWSTDPQTLERALALAQQALALDDSLPRAHSLLSSVYAQKQQYDQAIAEGERAIAFDPNNADSYAVQTDVLNFAGRPEDALRMVEQAMPSTPIIRRGTYSG